MAQHQVRRLPVVEEDGRLGDARAGGLCRGPRHTDGRGRREDLAVATTRTQSGSAWPRSGLSGVSRGGIRERIPPLRAKGVDMPSKPANVKNEKQYEALKDKGMSKERAAKIANSPDASKHGGESRSGSGDSSQGGTTAQKKAAGRKGGKATARKS